MVSKGRQKGNLLTAHPTIGDTIAKYYAPSHIAIRHVRNARSDDLQQYSQGDVEFTMLRHRELYNIKRMARIFLL